MYQTKKPTPPNAEQRNEKVRAVLMVAKGPMGPSEIATRIGEPWCYDGYPSSAAISPILKRIGAVGEKGKWSLKADGA